MQEFEGIRQLFRLGFLLTFLLTFIGLLEIAALGAIVTGLVRRFDVGGSSILEVAGLLVPFSGLKWYTYECDKAKVG